MNNPKIVLGMRIVLGLIFTVFGLNGFLNFIAMPPMPESALAFLGGLGAAPYFFPLLKVTEIACGVALLLNRYVSLSLVILAPIVINIVLFHAVLAPEGMLIPVVVLVCSLGVAKANWKDYDALLNG